MVWLDARRVGLAFGDGEEESSFEAAIVRIIALDLNFQLTHWLTRSILMISAGWRGIK